MDRKGFFKTLGFLGMGIVATKVIPEIKAKSIKKKAVKSKHHKDAELYWNAGDEARVRQMADEIWSSNGPYRFGEIKKLYFQRSDDNINWHTIKEIDI